MDEFDQELFSVQGNSKAASTGLKAELDVLDIMKNLDSVEKSWKDYNNSKFDIYYILKGENFVRGLQVKALVPVFGTHNGFTMSNLENYEKGMLIVAINKIKCLGLAFLYDEYFKTSTASVRFTKHPKGKFSKLLLYGEDFINKLSNLLCKALKITDSLYKNSLSPANLAEFESISRFLIYCEKLQLNVKRVKNATSHTDLIINGYKIQMKFSANQSNIKKRTYSYKISLAKSGNREGKRKIPYSKGDNDLYVIELGCNQGEFLVLTENLLIEKGYIKTEIQKGKYNLDVYPYDYTKKKKQSKTGPQIRGNWTCDESLWLSKSNFLENLTPYKNEIFEILFNEEIKMPETTVVAQYTDLLISKLFRERKGLYFIAAVKLSDKFEHINLNLLIPALRQPILDIFFKGKAYFIRFSRNLCIYAHHFMSGYWTFEPEKHAHFRFDFGLTPDAKEGVSLYYINTRFGDFEILNSELELENKLNRLAPGFIGRFLLSLEEWQFRISRFGKTKMVRRALMEQDSLCSGIGNFLCMEILYYAKLKPNATFGDLSLQQTVNLYNICLFTVKGHYDGTLEKVIYGKRYCPHGHEILKLKNGNRHIWYCGVEQN